MKIILSESQYKILMESLSENEESILIIGDSHSVDAGFTYSSLVKNKFKNVRIAAVGGKRTSWMKSELSKELSKNKYDKVVIWGGANDMFSNVSISEAISNIQQMVDMVNSQGGQAIIIIGFDQQVFSKKGKYKGTKYATSEQMDKMREKYIEFQKQLSGSIDNAIIIPAFDVDNSHTSDNMHGNSSAHRKVFEILSGFLSEPGIKKIDKKSEKGVELIKRLHEYVEKNKVFTFDEDYPIPYQSEVKDIQTALQFLGYSLPEWGVDGKFGRETQKAVENFQESQNMEKTGKMDIELLKLLVLQLIEKKFENEDLMKIEVEKTETLDNNRISDKIIIKDTSLNVKPYPSDLLDKFEKVSDGYAETFISDVKSIGLDPIIAIRQLYTESGFRPDVIKCSRKSSAGAMGIAQFMPGTWPSYGKGSPCDVKQSLKAYVRFMNYLLNRFPGRPDIAVASYNSGPNLKSYKKALENDMSFESLRGKIPNESYKYAATIFQS